MGEPAEIGPEELAKRVAFARTIVETERNDEESPSAIGPVAHFLRDNARRARANGSLVVADDMEQSAKAIETETFDLAQALVLATEELEAARKLAGHDPSVRCVACLGPLVPCDCRPDCPGGKCVPCGNGERDSTLRAELVRIRAKWNDDQGTLANHRFVTAVCRLLDEVG